MLIDNKETSFYFAVANLTNLSAGAGSLGGFPIRLILYYLYVFTSPEYQIIKKFIFS